MAADEPAGDGFDWYAIPNFAFGTDDGFGFGARAELAQEAPGYAPYEAAYMVHLFLTTGGYQSHRFRYDRVGLGPEGRLRLTVNVAWRHWLNDGYWGIGNGTTRERAYVRDFADGDPARKRYRYSLFQPFVHATLRADLGRPWQAFASLNTKWSVVRTYPGSLLEEQQPFGMEGGLATIVSAGVLFDTRAPEIDPKDGVLAELSGRYNPPLPHGSGAFGGVFASVRGFWALPPRVVLAGRRMAERLWGEIPFYEMVHWGGALPIAGFGGADTLRGLAFGRWHGPGKAIANLEARTEVLEHQLFSQPMRWQAVPYVDAGMVFGAGSRATNASSANTVHPAAGLGIRVIYEEKFVGRVDTGFGMDPIREKDGRVSRAATFGMYVVFEHIF